MLPSTTWHKPQISSCTSKADRGCLQDFTPSICSIRKKITKNTYCTLYLKLSKQEIKHDIWPLQFMTSISHNDETENKWEVICTAATTTTHFTAAFLIQHTMSSQVALSVKQKIIIMEDWVSRGSCWLVEVGTREWKSAGTLRVTCSQCQRANRGRWCQLPGSERLLYCCNTNTTRPQCSNTTSGGTTTTTHVPPTIVYTVDRKSHGLSIVMINDVPAPQTLPGTLIQVITVVKPKTYLAYSMSSI